MKMSKKPVPIATICSWQNRIDPTPDYQRPLDLSRFCAAPLITYCAAKGMNHGHRQDG